VGVLAVAELAGSFQGEVDGRWQGFGRGVEPGGDGGVVGRGVGERGPGELSPGAVRQPAGGAQLVEHGEIVAGVDDHAHVGVVLGRRPHHRRPADVDGLDRRLGHERVEVAHHDVDGDDPLGLQVGQVVGLAPVGQDPAVEPGVQRLHPSAEHLRALRQTFDGDDGQAGVSQGRGRPSAGHQIPPQFVQPPRQLDQARLVPDREEGPHRTPSSTKRRMVSG
jgi:hypothetical protein